MLGALIKLVVLSGASPAQGVRAAVASAVRDATGPNPGSACTAFSPAGLSQLLTQFGAGEAPAEGADQLVTCQQLVPRLRTQVTPQQLTELAQGSVRSVQFQTGGSVLVIYAAANGRLAAELAMSEHAGRWLIDSVDSGTIAGAE